jgi:cytochrome c553
MSRSSWLCLYVLTYVATSATTINAADVETKLQICDSCHGKDGLPSDATIPIIWGQQKAYLEKQLRDYKNGDRDSQIMSSMSEGLTQEEISNVAAHFADKSWPNKRDADISALTQDTITACQVCHQNSFLGGLAAGETSPRLAGQTREYLVDEMRSFANGERGNSAAMSALMKGLSTTELETIAQYLSSL